MQSSLQFRLNAQVSENSAFEVFSVGILVRALFVALAIFFLLALSTTVAHAETEVEAVENQFIVKFSQAGIERLKDSHPELRVYDNAEIEAALDETMGVTKGEDLDLIGAQTVNLEEGKEVDAATAVDLLEAGVLEYIERDYIQRSNRTPNDPDFTNGRLWGLHQSNDYDIDAPEAWDTITGSTGSNAIVIGVVDTGVNYNHPDLAANMWRRDSNGEYGWDAYSNDNDPNDEHGHGTHCAGTIAGVGDNGVGVTGVMWNAKIMALRFLGPSGSGSTSGAIGAINYAVARKREGVNLRVLSNSWGGGGFSQGLFDAISAANDEGILFVAAAGNSNRNTDLGSYYPSGYAVANVVSVAAISSNGARASFSNYGPTTVDLAAPGVGIQSAWLGSGYRSISGTSMATPHVSGVAGLVLANDPAITPADLKQLLMESAQPNSQLNGLMASAGVVNAAEALNGLDPNAAPVITAIEDQTVSPNDLDDLLITIEANDPDGDDNLLSYAAKVIVSARRSAAAELDRRHGFTQYLSDVSWGYGEKWLLGSAGYYWIYARRYLYRFTGTPTQRSGRFYYQGTIDPYFYDNPQELVSAYPASTDVTTSLSGNELRIIPGDDFQGSFDVEVSVSDESKTAREMFSVTVENSAPTVEAIEDRTMSPSVDSIAVDVVASDADGDSISLSATAVGVDYRAYQADQSHNFRRAYRDYQNLHGRNEKYLIGNAGWYFILPNGDLHRWRGSVNNAPLIAKLDPSFHKDLSKLIDVANPGSSSPATLTFSGSTLTIEPNDGFVGSFEVTIEASDAVATTEVKFNVEVVNRPPQLTPISDIAMSPTQDFVTLDVEANDPDGDSLSYAVDVKLTQSVAYTIDQTHNFRLTSYTYENLYGHGEKYLVGNLGWYFIMPNGKLHRWGGSIARSPLLGILDETYHEDLSKLVDVEQPSGDAGVAVSFSSNTLTVDPSADFSGVALVTVTVSDEVHAVDESFRVEIRNIPPVLEGIADQSMPTSQDTLTLALTATDADGDTLVFSARIRTLQDIAYELDQTHNFRLASSTYTNLFGHGEKFFLGVAGWYFILPNGEVHRWAGSIARSPLLGTLDASYHADLNKLVDVTLSGSDDVAVSVSANELTLDPRDDFMGSVPVVVTVTDGTDSDSESFTLTVTEAAAEEPEEAPETDSDGDGVSDVQEEADGTDPNDAGSYLQHLGSPIYTLWNSFLSMTNILELINPSNEQLSVSLSLYAIDGTLAHEQQVQVPAMNQFDVILNDLPGFVADSYGIIKLEFDGIVDGRTVFYRSATTANEYEFVFAVPLANWSRGTTGVGFNTFQPSMAADESEHLVSNWLTVVNLEHGARDFTIDTYDQAGELLASRDITVSAFGRMDVDGGHGIAGSNVVGLHMLRPADSSGKYLAQVIRYGGNAPAGEVPSEYSFAFSLPAKAGNGRTTNVKISNKFAESNWVEVVNTLDAEVEVALTFMDASGQELDSQTITLEPFAQRHFDASSLLANREIGVVTIDPAVRNSIIATSMFYFRDSADGSMAAMYGSSAREALSSDQFGSYNLFLGMDNWMTVANASDASTVVTVTVSTADAQAAQDVTIPANGSVNLALHDAEAWGTAANTYGLVTLNPSSGDDKIFAELLRVREVDAEMDFAVPTNVR